VNDDLQKQRDVALAYLERLSTRGRQIAERLQTTPDSAVDIRAWQQDVAVAINELSGGSKQHWLSRAFSQAFLVGASSGSSSPSGPGGDIVTEVSPADIVDRLLAVLAQARSSLATMEPLDAAAVAAAPAPAVRRFDFVHNVELRPVLEQAYADSARAAEAGDFHRAFFTSCGILEAIITDALEQKMQRKPDKTGGETRDRGSEKASASAEATADRSAARRVQEMTFDERIAVAESAGLIRGGCARLPSTARSYRDLAPDTIVSEREAKVVRQVLNVVIRDLDPGR
jgi:hypothetical protein